MALLGKEAEKPVYRVNIANIVDKYVGETSKKLEQLFNLAQKYDWILFFDEADALFGQRTSTSSAQDRYANQDVSYLLYKLEEYEGMIFLATNHDGNIDKAFTRRFDTRIRFTKPEEYVREQLFRHFFEYNHVFELDENILFDKLADKLQVTGAWIEKLRNYCTIRVAEKSTKNISQTEMIRYIRQHFANHGGMLRNGHLNDLFV